jgi:peptidoglycan hydrolase-like protein with peptidoglycan-binding domain
MGPDLCLGRRGRSIRLLQGALNYLDDPTRGSSDFLYSINTPGAVSLPGARLTVDGEFGRPTFDAVSDFQRYHGLDFDPRGAVGPGTFDYLFPCYLVTFKTKSLAFPTAAGPQVLGPRVVQYKPFEAPAPPGPYLPPLKKPSLLKQPGDDEDDTRWQLQLGYGTDGTAIALQYLVTKRIGLDFSVGAEGDFSFQKTGNKAQVFVNVQKTSLFKLRFSDQFAATFDLFAQPYYQAPLGKASDDTHRAVGIDFGVQGNVDLKPALRRWLGLNVPLSIYGQFKAGPQRDLEKRETNVNVGGGGGLIFSF